MLRSRLLMAGVWRACQIRRISASDEIPTQLRIRRSELSINEVTRLGRQLCASSQTFTYAPSVPESRLSSRAKLAASVASIADRRGLGDSGLAPSNWQRLAETPQSMPKTPEFWPPSLSSQSRIQVFGSLIAQRAGRSDLKADRSSLEKSSGSSQAAKWPPLSTALK